MAGLEPTSPDFQSGAFTRLASFASIILFKASAVSLLINFPVVHFCFSNVTGLINGFSPGGFSFFSSRSSVS
jgi:hypothetical protein